MMRRVMVMETEKWRLVGERLTSLRTSGCWSSNISSSEDRHDKPRNVTRDCQAFKNLTLCEMGVNPQ